MPKELTAENGAKAAMAGEFKIPFNCECSSCYGTGMDSDLVDGYWQSNKKCEDCDAVIPEARRTAVPGVRLCIGCQSELDEKNKKSSGYNRRGSKDSQLR